MDDDLYDQLILYGGIAAGIAIVLFLSWCLYKIIECSVEYQSEYTKFF